MVQGMSPPRFQPVSLFVLTFSALLGTFPAASRRPRPFPVPKSGDVMDTGNDTQVASPCNIENHYAQQEANSLLNAKGKGGNQGKIFAGQLNVNMAEEALRCA